MGVYYFRKNATGAPGPIIDERWRSVKLELQGGGWQAGSLAGGLLAGVKGCWLEWRVLHQKTLTLAPAVV
jgi:hypothetical protein